MAQFLELGFWVLRTFVTVLRTCVWRLRSLIVFRKPEVLCIPRVLRSLPAQVLRTFGWVLKLLLGMGFQNLELFFSESGVFRTWVPKLLLAMACVC